MFLTDREDEAFANDCEEMVEGRINYGLGSESISDGLPFFGLGFIKSDSHPVYWERNLTS